ncbi:phage Gp37/Gp68 family protein [Dehalogenimonas alkenigignens]
MARLIKAVLMSFESSIEWTQATWNPVTGCSEISPGCAHCYAARFANRLKCMGNPRYTNGFRVTLHDDLIGLPLSWKRPTQIFVNSMSDLFHEQIPLEFIEAVFTTIRTASWHRFQILTKRASRLLEISPYLSWPSNLLMGVTVENQDYIWRLEKLKKVPAAVKFVSCEPLLGQLNLPLEDLDWVIVGGESGPGARTMDLNWVREIRDQCSLVKLPFFLKQLGGTRNKRGEQLALLDGQLWKELPEILLMKS